MKQLEFSIEPLEVRLERSYTTLKTSVQRSIRGQYAEQSNLKKEMNELKYELQLLKSAICKQKTTLEPWLYGKD